MKAARLGQLFCYIIFTMFDLDANYIFKVRPHYQDLIEECIDDLNALNIPISKSILFKENTGFSRFGYCKKTPSGETDFVVAINKWFEEDKPIKETIMHELIHTVYGCYNHGKKFHQYADVINAKYNLDIVVIGNYKLQERAYKNKGSKRNVFKEEDFNPQTMVMMYCPKCHNTFAIKKTAFKFGSRWVCKRCRKQLLYV